MITRLTDFLRPRPTLQQAAQMLSEASVEARRAKTIRTANILRAELGLPEWRPSK